MLPDLKSQSSRFFILFILLSSVCIYFYAGKISLFPSFIHAWTQSDRYALALGFINNGFDFFHPQTFNLATLDGITRVDFPIHEYLVALLMQVTAIHEPVIFRLYTLCYAMAGLIFLARLSQLFLEQLWKPVFIALFLFACPVFLYYADGFIPSIASLSNLFIAYFFYFSYRRDRTIKYFRIALVFFTLAALARLPFFIFLFAIFCQHILLYWKEKKANRKELFFFVCAFVAFLSYQLYNAFLGNTYGTQFLMKILPPSGWEQAKKWLAETWNQWGFQYFTKAHYAILGILVLAFLVNARRRKSSPLEKALARHTGLAALGCVIYFILMMQQFPDHDYYFIDSFYPLVVLLLIRLIHFDFQSRQINTGAAIVLFAALLPAYAGSRVNFNQRHETAPWDRVEITRKNFENSGKFLDSIGISHEDKVLVLDGYTTNVPLILMNRKGWTVNWTTLGNIQEGMKKPFDFVAIQHAFIASDVIRNDPSLIGRLEKFADDGYVGYYRKAENASRTMDQFLGIDYGSSIFDSTIAVTDSVNEPSEFITLFSRPWEAIKPVKALVCGWILPENGNLIDLVASVTHGGKTNFYFSFDLRDYIESGKVWQQIQFQFLLPAAMEHDAQVKVYLWNKNKNTFAIHAIRTVLYR